MYSDCGHSRSMSSPGADLAMGARSAPSPFGSSSRARQGAARRNRPPPEGHWAAEVQRRRPSPPRPRARHVGLRLAPQGSVSARRDRRGARQARSSALTREALSGEATALGSGDAGGTGGVARPATRGPPWPREGGAGRPARPWASLAPACKNLPFCWGNADWPRSSPAPCGASAVSARGTAKRRPAPVASRHPTTDGEASGAGQAPATALATAFCTSGRWRTSCLFAGKK
jgi:hypothetical protein